MPSQVDIKQESLPLASYASGIGAGAIGKGVLKGIGRFFENIGSSPFVQTLLNTPSDPAAAAANLCGKALSEMFVPDNSGVTKFQKLVTQNAEDNVSVNTSQGINSGIVASASPASVSIAGAPVTSAVAAISDPELRANAYNEIMLNSAHQREVADLIKAGLNPALSAKLGGSDSMQYNNIVSGSSGGYSGADSSFTLPMIKNANTVFGQAWNAIAQDPANAIVNTARLADTASRIYRNIRGWRR